MLGNDLLQPLIKSGRLLPENPGQRLRERWKTAHFGYGCHRHALHPQLPDKQVYQLTLPVNERLSGNAPGHVIDAQGCNRRIKLIVQTSKSVDRILRRVACCGLEPPFDGVVTREFANQIPRKRLRLSACANTGR